MMVSTAGEGSLFRRTCSSLSSSCRTAAASASCGSRPLRSGSLCGRPTAGTRGPARGSPWARPGRGTSRRTRRGLRSRLGWGTRTRLRYLEPTVESTRAASRVTAARAASRGLTTSTAGRFTASSAATEAAAASGAASTSSTAAIVASGFIVVHVMVLELGLLLGLFHHLHLAPLLLRLMVVRLDQLFGVRHLFVLLFQFVVGDFGSLSSGGIILELFFVFSGFLRATDRTQTSLRFINIFAHATRPGVFLRELGEHIVTILYFAQMRPLLSTPITIHSFGPVHVAALH